MAIEDYSRALGMVGQRVQPDPLQMAFGGINQGLQMGAQMAQRQSQIANENRRTELLRQQQEAARAAAAQYESDARAFTADVNPSSTREFLVKYPERGAKIAQALAKLSDEERMSKAKEGFGIGRAMDSGDYATAASIIEQSALRAEAAGDKQGAAMSRELARELTSGSTEAIRAMRANIAAATMIAAGPETVEKWTNAAIGARDAESDKRTERMKAIAEADSAVSRAMSDGVTADYAESKAKNELAKQRADIRRLNAAARGLSSEDQAKVQRSTMYNDGTIIHAMKDATFRITTPGVEGNVPLDQQAAVIRRANNSGIAYEGDVVGTRESRKVSVKEGANAYKTLGAMQKSVDMFDRQIAALDDGARVGAVYDMLPTFDPATKLLESLQAAGALDRLALQTMGALSREELKILMKISIPTGLGSEKLRSYLVERKRVVKKALPLLRQQARFLIDGKGKISDWIDMHDASGRRKPESINAAEIDISEFAD